MNMKNKKGGVSKREFYRRLKSFQNNTISLEESQHNPSPVFSPPLSVS